MKPIYSEYNALIFYNYRMQTLLAGFTFEPEAV